MASFFQSIAKRRLDNLSWKHITGLIWVAGICFFLGQNASFMGSFFHDSSKPAFDDYSLVLKNHQSGSNKFRERGRIQHILNVNASFWKRFRTTETKVGQKIVDITRNVPRVEDFLKQDNAKNVERDLDDSDNMNQQETGSTKESKSERLNIVLFYADDWTMKVLGALNPHVKTPNIDGMASRGMLFTRNCVTTSICWTSRNTLATGLYASVHKTVMIHFDDMFNKSVPWLETLYPRLKSNGYFTGLVGKWHAPSPPEFMSKTFDRSNFYYGDHWLERDGKKRHVTDLNGEDALSFLQKRPKEKPFSLTVAFFATHAIDYHDPPYKPMPDSMKLYQNVTIPRPKTATKQHHDDLPWFMKSEKNEGRVRWRNRFDTEANYQDKIKNLYRMATEVDAVVGAVIDELKAQGVYEKTLLVFTTDNGNLHGEHGLAEKWYAYEESIRVPLVIEDPRMPPEARGTRNDEFTLSVDLAPTLLAAANIPPPAFMQGRDIAQLYLKPKSIFTWRQDFFYEFVLGGNLVTGEGHPNTVDHIPAVFALVRKDYKYFYWPQANYEQLFHVEKDPFEETDIFNETTTLQALDLMKARYAFLKLWAQSGNPV